MNNVISLARHRTPQTPNIFFPVKESVLEIDFNGQKIVDPSRKVIVREDTNQIIGVHKRSYRLIENRDIFPIFEEALRHTSIDTHGMKIKDEITHDGARTIRSYVFPYHTVDVNPRVGDKVSMELKVVNSYDGSTAFRSMVGGNRLICTNGMVAFKAYMQSYGKHTQHLNLQRVVFEINKALGVYLEQESMWKRWVNFTVADDQARAVLKAMPGHNDILEEKIWLLYQDEQLEHGKTVWALYNALTYWSTHADIRQSSQGNRAAIQMEREQKVRGAMLSSAFRAIAA